MGREQTMENEMLRWTLTILLVLLLLLLCIAYRVGIWRMARICNWNGRRYCYLGSVPIHKRNGNFVIRIGEHMVDLSRTTAYQICVSRAFFRKNRYRSMFVYVDGARNYLVLDRPVMRFIWSGL